MHLTWMQVFSLHPSLSDSVTCKLINRTGISKCELHSVYCSALSAVVQGCSELFLGNMQSWTVFQEKSSKDRWYALSFEDLKKDGVPSTVVCALVLIFLS